MDQVHRRLARRIRSLAKTRRVVLSHVPDRAGVTRSHFFRVLRGESSPTVAWLELVAVALEVDVGDLLAREEKARGARRAGEGRRRR